MGKGISSRSSEGGGAGEGIHRLWISGLLRTICTRCARNPAFWSLRGVARPGNVCVMASDGLVCVESHRSEWQLAGVGVENFRLINEFLGYLTDRAYSPLTVRAYAF